MLEFCGFHGFLSEFSAWSCELKWSCQISCLSVTGKMKNLQKNTCIFAKIGQFVVHHRHTCEFKTSALLGLWETIRKCTFKKF